MGLAEELQDETAEVLAKLIRFKTVNPPGDERECQEWLAGYLEDAGLRSSSPAPSRSARTWWRSCAGATGPALGYLSHVDTVLADAEDWSADPWGGEIRDGFLYGRGAIDMKSQTAAEAVAAKHLARNGRFNGDAEDHQRRRRGDRRGSSARSGSPRSARTCRRSTTCSTRARGAVMPYGDRRLYGVCVAEKGTFRFNVAHRRRRRPRPRPRPRQQRAAQARPDHHAGSARAAPASTSPRPPARCVAALGEDPEDPAAALEAVRAVSPQLAPLLDAAMSVTFAPTIVSAGEKINVIPARAQVRVDCRVPPEMDEDDRAEARPRGARRRTATSSSSPRRSSATARPSSPS